MKIAERTEEAGYRRIRQSLSGLESFIKRQVWPARLALARKALDQIPANDRNRAAFHVVAGWLASAEGNFAEQEEQFAAAVNKEPKNDLYQFNLAALQIHSIDAQKKANARENLERLSKLVPYRTGALRALLNEAVARNDLSAADK